MSPSPPQPITATDAPRSLLNRLGRGLALGLLATPLVIYGWALHQRPLAQDQAPQPLFQGITYGRQYRLQPRPQLIHRLTLDLTTPGLSPWVTPAIAVTHPERATQQGQHNNAQKPNDHRETIAQKATTALANNNLQLVVNANFFFPFQEDAPWQTAPAPGDPVSVVGTAIAQGQRVSQAEDNWPALCFFDDKAEIDPNGTCPPNTQEAVAGNLMLIEQGQAGDTTGENLTKPYPMVIAALDSTGEELQLIMIDGKQPFYSEGITLPEVIALLQDWGIYNAIRLDGGGSSSLAIEDAQGHPRLLNAVIQAKIPGRERPVANHLGFYAQPVGAEP